jgi:WD40 repeat protein/serine/threonine protein kinase
MTLVQDVPNGTSPRAAAAARKPIVALDDSRVIQAVEEYQAAQKAGAQPDREAFLARHAAIAEALGPCLDGLELVQAAAPDLSQPAGPLGSPAVERAAMGDFRIVREIGRGGMGVVYEAEQISLGRRVALKVLPLAGALDAKHLQRFKKEAQAAAHLHHTHIVPVISVGCEHGVHYYAMQLIDGQSLAALVGQLREQCEERGAPDTASEVGREAGIPAAAATSTLDTPAATLPIRSPTLDPRSLGFFHTVAQLTMQAAEALEHAHGRGVVHRDIKPGNLLVDVQGNLWVTDFGLARLQGEVGLTLTGDVVGTLRYMSPEQASARRGGVDHRTDIYSLGATLYELLTLEPPFAGRDRQELQRQIAVEEPQSPRHHNPTIPADLETICLKALAKEPSHRYQTAGDFAADLRRFLAGQPIRARRVGPLERLWRWGRRNPAPAAAGVLAVVAFAAVVALGVGSVFAVQLSAEQQQTQAALQTAEEQGTEAARQRARAEHQEKLVRHYLYAAHMTLAQRAWESDEPGLMRELLEQHRPQRPGDEDLRGFEWHYLWRLAHPNSLLTFTGHTAAVVQLAYSPDGKRLVSRSADGTVKEWDVATGQEIRAIKLKDYPQGRGWAQYSPDGKQIVAASRDGTMKVWDATTGQQLRTVKSPIAPGDLVSQALGPDGKWVALGNVDGTVALCDATTGQVVHTLKGDTAIAWQLAFSPDGQRLSCTHNPMLRVWDVTTGQVLHTLKDVRHVAFSPDGNRLASRSKGGAVQVWDVTTGQELHTHWEPSDTIGARNGAFSSDGTRLATNSGSGGAIRVWDIAPGRAKGSKPLLHSYKGSTSPVLAMAFSPDGRHLAAGKGDGTVQVWDATTGPEEARTVALQGDSVAYRPDGKQLALGSKDSTVKICDASTGQEVRTLKGHTGIVWRVAYSPDGSRLASSSSDQTVKLWDASTGQEVRTLKGHTGTVWSVAFSPDGKHVASASGDGTVRVWNAQTGQEVRSLKGHTGGGQKLAYSPDGKRLASASEDDPTVKVWDTTTGQELLTLTGHRRGISALAFSPDGKRLASSGQSGQPIKVWDATTGQEVHTLRYGHRGSVWHLAYSPDGKRLASASMDSTVRIWDTTTGQALLTLKGHRHTVRGVAFSPDGTRLASADLNQTLKIWDTAPLPAKPKLQLP